MTPKDQLIATRNVLQKAVDNALESLPEFRALQSVEQAIEELEKAEKRSRKESEVETAGASASLSYSSLALNALKEAGHPLSTPEVIEFIQRFRVVTNDAERAKINISSALSKDERLVNVFWQGGRAWWFEGVSVPARQLDKTST